MARLLVLLAPLLVLLLTKQCLAASDEEGTCSAVDEQCAAPSLDKSSTKSSWYSLLVPGVNGVPAKYLADMLSFTGAKFSWLSAFCDGEARGCQDKIGFPGPQTHSQIGWERVRQLGSEMPRKEWSGEWWRGNELGTVINNPYYYYAADANNNSNLSPLSIALGISPKQHAAIRPIFERAFMLNKNNFDSVRKYVEHTAAEMLADRKAKGSLNHVDIKIWFHKVINKITFNRHVDDTYCRKFIATQGKFLSTQIISQSIPSVLYGQDPLKLGATRESVKQYVDEYKQLLLEQYADLLEGQDCSPSASCAHQAAYGIFDAFVAAGGVSVPGTIFQSLAVAFSTDPSNPAGKPLSYRTEEADQMIWEAIRIFPPVVVFPYWSPRPTCSGLDPAQTAALNHPNGETAPCPLGAPHKRTGFPEVNQYKGGKRWMPNVAIAQQDPDIWGEDAKIFKLRPLEHYEKYSLGFAEMAVDPNVANGRMNRMCPGRSLALLMGKTFLSMFRPDEWTVNPEEPIKIKTGGPYVGDFPIFLREPVEKCIKERCSCTGSEGFFKRLSCKRCVKKNCYKL